MSKELGSARNQPGRFATCIDILYSTRDTGLCPSEFVQESLSLAFRLCLVFCIDSCVEPNTRAAYKS